ncbi:unnamed protein product, partial [Urochloa humidicola]
GDAVGVGDSRPPKLGLWILGSRVHGRKRAAGPPSCSAKDAAAAVTPPRGRP